MTSEIYNLELLDSTATVRTPTTGPPEVMVAYDGTRPPLTVFLNLGAVGFAGMAAQPPPADAIDWSTPDPLRGTAHTVLPFRAVSIGHFDGAPKDRGRAIDAARLILERLAGPSLPPPPDAPPPPVAAANGNGNDARNGKRDLLRPTTASPVPTSAANGTNGRTIDAALAANATANATATPTITAAPTVPAASATPAPPAVAAAPTVPATPATPATATTDTTTAADRATPAAPAAAVDATTLEIVVDAAMVPELRAVLSAHARVTEERPVTWTTEVRYRGSVEEKHHPALRFTVAVDPAREESLMVALSAYRLRSLEVIATRLTTAVSAG